MGHYPIYELMNKANVILTFTQLSFFFFFNALIGNWGLNLPNTHPQMTYSETMPDRVKKPILQLCPIELIETGD